MATVRLIVLLGGILLFLGNTHTDTQTSPEAAFHLFGLPQFLHAFIIIVMPPMWKRKHRSFSHTHKSPDSLLDACKLHPEGVKTRNLNHIVG